MATSTNNLIDPCTLRAGCGGDPILLQMMIGSFQSQVPQHLDDLRDAAQRRDSAQLQYTAHRLRGLVSAFSPNLAAAIAVMEQPATDQKTHDPMAQCVVVEESVDALATELANISTSDL
jgi:HPt (histidine-containing phosphotransfer) domain-containing protein